MNQEPRMGKSELDGENKSSGKSDDLILVGRVTSVFGIKGWVNVFSHTEPKSNLIEFNDWYLYPCQSNVKNQGYSGVRIRDCKKVSVTDGKTHGKKLIAQINNCTLREAAENFINHEIFVPRDVLPDLEEGFYWADLIGAQVENKSGDSLGEVDHLLETGVKDVLVVTEAGRKDDILIPFVLDHYILNVDLERKKILVDWDFE